MHILQRYSTCTLYIYTLRAVPKHMFRPLSNVGLKLINQPTPLSRVLLEKLTVSQLVTKFGALYGTRRFITRHWLLP